MLRTDWGGLEPADGGFDFTIIDNIFTKLTPLNQKLSLIVTTSTSPAWLLALPGITTWTAGSPSVTAPLPWDTIAQERFRGLLVALGDHIVEGVPLRDHPRLAAINVSMPGLKSGIRDLTEIRIRDLPAYSRANMHTSVLTHLNNMTDNFPNVPIHLGFWTYTDATASPTPWEVLRQAILAQFNGTTRPRIGFWMENLAASRPAADTDPWTGLPTTTYTAPLYLSQDSEYVGYQMLGSWAQPFSATHVPNLLNGSPEDGLDYGFNTFQCRYYEVYQADVDFANYPAEFQRWHDFLAALPAPAVFQAVPARNADGTISLTWPATIGRSYQVEVSSDLVTWTPLGSPLQATASAMTWIDDGTQTGTHPSTSTRRIYRVRISG